MIRLSPDSMAHRGAAVARVDGKAHFVDGAIPGEVVIGEVVADKGSWARVRLTGVEERSADRIDPVCPHFERCGGCDWQFARHERQLEWKREIVAGQLQHLGRILDPDVRSTATAGPPLRYRNRMDFTVANGRPALHHRASSGLEPIDECHLLLPDLHALFLELGDLGPARRVTLRMAATTGERHVIVEGGPAPEPDRWDAAISHATKSGTRPVSGAGAIHEEIDGFRYQITGRAFFQTNTAVVPVLIDLVREALEAEPGETLLDAYAGGGLFAIAAAPPDGRVVAIESSGAALRDLRNNLGRSPIPASSILSGRVEATSLDRVGYVDLVVADPPRAGLRASGVAVVTAPGPRTIAYVSCDPASLGRDAALLAAEGYRLAWAAPVDLFPQTYHIETVAAFRRDV